MNKTRKNNKKHIIFSDHPDFTPSLTPREMFLLGSFVTFHGTLLIRVNYTICTCTFNCTYALLQLQLELDLQIMTL